MTSWLFIQIATQVSPFFEIPGWIVRLIIVLLAAGFPIAVMLAWAFELTPGGIVKTPEKPASRTSDWNLVHKIYSAVVAILALALMVLLYLRFAASHSTSHEAILEKS